MKARILLQLWIYSLPGIMLFIHTKLGGIAPPDVINAITYAIGVVGTWGLCKWLGLGVADFQRYLKSVDKYNGKIDGIFGPLSMEGAKEAVNDDDVTAQGPPGKIVVKRAKPVDEPGVVARPPWSKMH